MNEDHTYLLERNGRVSWESRGRLKADFASASDAGHAPRTEEHNLQPTKQGMAVGRKHELVETSDLRNRLRNRLAFRMQRESTEVVDSRHAAAEAGTQPEMRKG